MSAVVKAVKTVAKAAVSVVKAVAEPVISVAKKAFNLVGNVVEKVGNAVSSVVNTALKDPIGTIAKVAAVATGNAWALPLIDGATTMAKGGSFGDALKSAAISYATLEGGQFVGNAVGAAAAKAGASATVAKIIGSGVGSSSVAIITGQDPVKAFATGGLTAGVPAMLGQIDGFSDLSKSTQNAVANAVTAQMTGRDPTGAIIGGVIQATGIVTDAIKAVDPEGKLSAEQKSIMSNALMSSTIAAVQGKDVSAALAKSLTLAGTKMLGDMIKSGFAGTGDAVAAADAAVQKNASAMESNIASQKDVSAKFDAVNDKLEADLNKQNELYSTYTTAKAAFDKDTTNEANYNAAQKALDAYNTFTTDFTKTYNDYYAPTLADLEGQLTTLQTDYTKLTDTSVALNNELKTTIDSAQNKAVEVQAATNKEFVAALDPNFDAEAYAKLNGIDPAKTDVYEDYLAKGQFDGNVTNYEAYLNSEFAKLDEFDKDMYAEDYQAALDLAKTATSKDELDAALSGITTKIDESVTTKAEATDYLTSLYKELGIEREPTEAEINKLMTLDEAGAKSFADDTSKLVSIISSATGKSIDEAYAAANDMLNWWEKPGAVVPETGVPTEEEQQPSVGALVNELAPYEPPITPEPEIPEVTVTDERPDEFEQDWNDAMAGKETIEDVTDAVDEVAQAPAEPDDFEKDWADMQAGQFTPDEVAAGDDIAANDELLGIINTPTGGTETPTQPSGNGYYNEITGEWVPDENGALQGELTNETSGTADMSSWMVDPSKGLWKNTATGEEWYTDPWDPTKKGLSGYDIMKNAGALPDSVARPPSMSAPKTTAPTTPAAPTTTTKSVDPMAAVLALLNATGGGYTPAASQASESFLSDWGTIMDVGDKFDPTLFGKSASQTPTQTTKIATGGYLDDLLKLLK